MSEDLRQNREEAFVLCNLAIHYLDGMAKYLVSPVENVPPDDVLMLMNAENANRYLRALFAQVRPIKEAVIERGRAARLAAE